MDKFFIVCCLPITFANSLDPDQAGKSVQNCSCFFVFFFKSADKKACKSRGGGGGGGGGLGNFGMDV